MSISQKWIDSMIMLIFGGLPWQAYFQRVLSANTDKSAQGEPIEIRHESTESSESEKRDDSPIEITSSLVNRWARDQQTKDLEDGEIIDDDLQIVSVSKTGTSKGFDIGMVISKTCFE